MRAQIPMWSDASDGALQFIREMGITDVSVMFHENDWDYDSVSRLQERMAKYDLVISDGGAFSVFKNPIIHLGLEGKDEEIKKYNQFTRVMGKCNIPICSLAWQPDGAVRSWHKVGKHSRGSVTGIVDMEELDARGYSHDRFYSKEEIWENFKYFLDRTLPVAEECNVKMALHPNDPPASCVMGVSSLIYTTEDFKRAFEIADNSPYLGMKLCVGCWLEGGRQFGKLYEDIRYFAERKKILAVHLRNISSPMPYFEEVLLEDGYGDMAKVIRELKKAGYDGLISVDHVTAGVEEFGGMTGAYGYSTGYLKGLIAAVDG